MSDGTKTIRVSYLTRVEGEGALDVEVEGGKVKTLQLRIFEPPRFFEAMLRGREYTEAPDITSRICGICPVAYQATAVAAMENALDWKVTDAIRDLRRLVYCGEWIESHTLHLYMLHAPDFLGVPSAIDIAKKDRATVERGLQLKKVGNEILTKLGGREIHPINLKVGGFYRFPPKKELEDLRARLVWAIGAARETVDWVASFSFPRQENDYEYVALRSERGLYPIDEGRLVSSRGIDAAPPEFESIFQEEHVPHSTALQCRIKERGEYLVGPLARFNLNFDRLPEHIRDKATSLGLEPECRNISKSILVRAFEIQYVCEEALRLLDQYEPPRSLELPAVKAGIGHAWTEAPRGVLYHRYEIDAQGKIVSARIVPPTSQNQGIIERDLRELVESSLALPQEKLQQRCEETIRSYDPCISCATHFLKMRLEVR